MFGRWPPSYGLLCRHIKGLSLHNVDILLEGEDARKAVYMNDIRNAMISQCSVNGERMGENMDCFEKDADAGIKEYMEP